MKNVTYFFPLSNGLDFTLIDAEDYEKIKNQKWHLHHDRKRPDNLKYARKRYGNGHILLHRLILNPHKLKQVDHINGNGLDNRRENLRIVTGNENGQNRHHPRSSQYPGVCFCKQTGKWISQVQYDNKKYWLGRFNTSKEAQAEYQNAYNALINGEKVIIKKPNFTSRFKGVSWNKNVQKWQVHITINKKSKNLGYFKSEEAASLAYIKKAVKISEIIQERYIGILDSDVIKSMRRCLK
jgi:hypothetical protein